MGAGGTKHGLNFNDPDMVWVKALDSDFAPCLYDSFVDLGANKRCYHHHQYTRKTNVALIQLGMLRWLYFSKNIKDLMLTMDQVVSHKSMDQVRVMWRGAGSWWK